MQNGYKKRRYFTEDSTLHSLMPAAWMQPVCPDHRAYVAHASAVRNDPGHERKEDLIPVGNDHALGDELFLSLGTLGNPLQALVLLGHRALGAESKFIPTDSACG